ncbi:MAG: glycerophosphodiester phosphodiesterase family protein [Myxococcota bacterium]
MFTRKAWAAGVVVGVVVSGCSATQGQAVVVPYRAINGPVIIAHRGGSLEAPENTVAAVSHGLEVGADWVEVDVVLSKDGHVMVVHEDELERYAHVEGRVSEKPLKELRQISVSNPGWSDAALGYLETIGVRPPEFGDRFADETIPTLDEVLALGGRVMIEMKSTEEPQALADAVLESVKNAFAYERVILGSFDPALLDAVALRDPSLPRVAILEDVDGLEEMLARGPTVVAIRADRAEEALERVPQGIAVWLWTIYTPAMAREAAELGVHGLITDVPKAVVKELRGEKSVYVAPPQTPGR